MYTIGLLKNNSSSNERAIVVWRAKDDPMQFWHDPVVLEELPGSSLIELDKPHITVSWYWQTRGHVYAAYSRLANTDEIIFRKSIDGGVSFDSPVIIDSNAQSAISLGVYLVSSPYSGRIFAFWTDFTTDEIKWSMSANEGASWIPAQVFARASQRDNKMMLGFLINQKDGTRAVSLPIARYNWPVGEISVVWHECNSLLAGENCSTETDVFYGTLAFNNNPPTGICNPAATAGICPSTPARINDNTTGDQFMPALDFNTSGNLMVTFYDKRNDPQNHRYQLFGAWVNHNGQNLQPNELASPLQSAFNSGFIGDYHETYSHTLFGTERFFTAWIHAEEGQPPVSDTYVSELSP
jgi:hypothetical protein